MATGGTWKAVRQLVRTPRGQVPRQVVTAVGVHTTGNCAWPGLVKSSQNDKHGKNGKNGQVC